MEETVSVRDEYSRHAASDRSPLHADGIRGIAERAAADPIDLSFDEISELGTAVLAHLRADPRF